MDNDEVVMLLREIRDLQKMHVEHYKDAQSKARRLQKTLTLALIIVALVGTAIIVFPSFTGH